MAFEDDLRSFLENRLLAFDAGIDLTPGSPAQVQIIDPVVARFEQDPFATDIPTFIQDLLVQNFPELAADNGGLLGDLFSKPFQLLLEPFKREIELVKLGQSANNASLMADAEADALGANFFEPRNEGGFSGGSVRLYFAQPTTQRVTPDKRVFTASGLSFFPTESFFITSAQMLFNRQGNRYFMDITVRAEVQGDDYNVDRGEIIGIEDVSGVVQVTNLAKFTDGTPRQTNEEYLGGIQDALTERSLVTRRGILTRVPDLFESVRALSVVGAGDVGMDRDILTGTGEGFLHLTGKAVAYGDWLFVSEIIYKDDGPDNNLTPQNGDLIRFHLPSLSVTDPTVVVEARVVSILNALSGVYLFLLDQTLSSSAAEGRFALFKPGFITISGVPGGQGAALAVPDDEVHLGGHTDVFVRPTADSQVQSTLESVTDDDPLLALVDVLVNNPLRDDSLSTPDQNIISSVIMGAAEIRPQVGDLFVIETGAGYAGTYRIMEIDSPNGSSVRVDAILPAFSPVSSPLRARVVRNIRIDLIEPRIPKLPFNTGAVSDLNTNVGSSTFTLDTVDIQTFGAVVGDVIRILDGEDAGDFVITGFDLVLGGKGPIVDRAATATAAGLRYEVFTAQTGITPPLVRIKSLEVLDSTQQGTGIKVPYGDTVLIRPLADLEGAGQEQKVLEKQMFLFPDLSDIWGNSQIVPFGSLLLDQRPSAVLAGNDSRYTQRLEVADGIVRRVNASGSNPIINIEINLPPFAWNGKRDKLLAFTTEKDLDFTGTGDHQTSPVVDAKIGDTITLLHGPNQGSYIIRDKRVLGMWGKTSVGHRKVTLLQVDPEMPNDPFRTAVNLIQSTGGAMTATDLMGLMEWCTDFDNPGGFYVNTFLPRLLAQMATLGINFADVDELKTFFDPLIRSGCSVGPAAKGDFRLYFTEPVSTEFYYKDDPTMFVGTTDASKRFRIDPALPSAQVFPESEIDQPPTEWARTLDPNPIPAGGNYPDARLLNGSFPAKGIRVGDQLEFHSAINDLPARPNMTSSWMCVTQAGSNIIRLMLPPQAELDNFALVQAGQLLFIDSGPDIGAYIITSVEQQNLASNPPDIRVRINKSMTHSTEDFPPTTFLDISSPAGGSGFFAYHMTSGNSFISPMSLTGLVLRFEISTNYGATFPSFKTHTFGAGPFNDISSVVSDCTADLTAGGLLTVAAVGDELVVATTAKGPGVQLRLAGTSDSVGPGLLEFPTPPATRNGGRGAAALRDGKRIYGSGLPIIAPSLDGRYVTIYAAKSAAILGLDSIANPDPTSATTADDAAYVGTYQIVLHGTEDTGPYQGEKYLELDRSANFPALPAINDDQVQVRWVVNGIPDTPPAETTDGGKEISDQFVRFRLYESVPHRLLVSSIPWNAPIHPLDPASLNQIETDGSLIPTATPPVGTNHNYNYKMPYRFTRPGVKRFSSTAMATKREGALYYIDLPVVGLGPGAEMNVSSSANFKLAGRSTISGYVLQVKNTIFTFSAKEEVDIILPKSVLPVGSTPELDNEFNLAGQNIQVVYDNAPLIEDIQRFFDSPQDRVLVANSLVRHFLPSYVFLDVNYTGGSSVDVTVKDLINYINNISPDRNILEASKVVDLVKKRGATGVTLPIVLVALTHGIDRSIRGMRSEDMIGGDNVPAFEGTFNQSYFISGPDTSLEPTRPDNEQVFLKRT